MLVLSLYKQMLRESYKFSAYNHRLNHFRLSVSKETLLFALHVKRSAINLAGRAHVLATGEMQN